MRTKSSVYFQISQSIKKKLGNLGEQIKYGISIGPHEGHVKKKKDVVNVSRITSKWTLPFTYKDDWTIIFFILEVI